MFQDAKPGAVMEASVWFNAQHDSERAAARRGVRKVMTRAAKDAGVVLSIIKWTEMAPDHQRAPDPPASFAGTPHIMLGEARVLGMVH